MLNDDTANLKSHLKTLHANLAQTDQVDEELQGLLMQLDGDIQTLLDKRAAAAQATISDAAWASKPKRPTRLRPCWPNRPTPPPTGWPSAPRKSPPNSPPSTRAWNPPCASWAGCCRTWVSDQPDAAMRAPSALRQLPVNVAQTSQVLKHKMFFRCNRP